MIMIPINNSYIFEQGWDLILDNTRPHRYLSSIVFEHDGILWILWLVISYRTGPVPNNSATILIS